MTFPADITTTTLTAGPSYAATGEPLEIRATITPLIGPARRLTWHDGATITGAPTNHQADPGEQVTITVPDTDQDGWTDPAGNTVTGWAYRVTITTRARAVTAIDYTVTVQPTTADGPIDLDNLTDPTGAGIVEPTTVNAYALKSEIPAPVDLSPYVLRDELSGSGPTDLTGYVTEGELSAALEALPDPAPVNLDGYALKTELHEPPDLTPYALKTEIPDPVDLAPYALKSEIPGAPDLTGYATESYVNTAIDAIPEPDPVDLSPYATTSGVEAIVGNAAKDTGTRDVSYMLNTANVVWAPTPGYIYLRRIGNLVMFWGSGIRTTKTGPQNVTEALPAGFRPPLANYNGPILTDGSSSFLGTATLRENTVNSSVTYGVNFNVAVLHNYSSFFLTMPCADPWPTTLPGTAA